MSKLQPTSQISSQAQQSIIDVGSKTCDPNATPPTEQTTRIQLDSDLEDKDKKQVEADAYDIIIILLGVPNSIYSSIDCCKDAKVMWEHVRRLMQGTELSKQDMHTKLVNEFDIFKSVPGESLESYYHWFSKIMNDLESHDLLPKKIVKQEEKNSFL
ncbi:hypothetical protein Tco_0048917 [Tanacetum coccineum]